MINPNVIDRLNELSKISKTRELTKDEALERENLRKQYLKEFRAGFRQHLDNVKVVDENGNDVTPNRKGDA